MSERGIWVGKQNEVIVLLEFIYVGLPLKVLCSVVNFVSELLHSAEVVT